MKSWFHILILSFLMISSVVSAQKPRIDIDLDRSEIRLGEQIKALVRFQQPADGSLEFPVIADTLSAKVEVVERSEIDTSFEGSNLETKVYSQVLLITSFDTGYHAIHPIFSGTGETMVLSDPLLISVMDVEVEMPEATQQGQQPEIAIKDIKDIKDAPFSLWEWIKMYKYWIIGIILLIAAIWAYFKYIQPRLLDQNLTGVIPNFEIPADKIAKRKLKELEDRKLWQSGKFKEYHIELSEILREYIENRYLIPALESTTPEILEDLNDKVKDMALTDLRSSLELSDLVKFAKYVPVQSENEKCMEFSYRFIDMSKEEEELIVNMNEENV